MVHYSLSGPEDLPRYELLSLVVVDTLCINQDNTKEQNHPSGSSDGRDLSTGRVSSSLVKF